jgi:hypothetical protein
MITLSANTLKEINKLRLNQKFDTQFEIKNIKKELLISRYGKLRQMC